MEGQALSPPTGRVIQVVELLSRHPRQRLSLARIARETDISRATAHAVLGRLTAEGWTVRDEHGDYGLGFGFAALARRAQDAFPLRRLAHDPLRALSERAAIPVFLAERDGDTITITDVVGHPTVEWIRLGRRLPFHPPVCREFAAWAPADQQQAWLAAAQPETHDRLTRVLTAIRERGFSVERLADSAGSMLDMLGALPDSPVADSVRHRLGEVLGELVTVDYLPDELGPDNAVVTVAAPVFADHTVVASIVACPDKRLTTAELTALGEATKTAAAQVSTALPTRH